MYMYSKGHDCTVHATSFLRMTWCSNTVPGYRRQLQHAHAVKSSEVEEPISTSGLPSIALAKVLPRQPSASASSAQHPQWFISGQWCVNRFSFGSHRAYVRPQVYVRAACVLRCIQYMHFTARLDRTCNAPAPLRTAGRKRRQGLALMGRK
jgi:hypothetical protein